MSKSFLIFIVFILCAIHSNSQNLFFTRSGQIRFISKTDAIDIEGVNDNVTTFFNAENGEVVVQLLIKSFKFTLATAEEHFNDTYMESDKYPRASFKGIVSNLDEINPAENGTYSAKVDGDLTIRGITKPVSQTGEVTVKDGKIVAKASFQVDIDDYKIKVPRLVEDRVAQTVDVSVNFEYLPYEQ
jgi:polyisoprenoid-binding protein YceI